MPTFVEEVSPPTLVIDRAQSSKEDWYTAQTRFRQLMEKHNYACEDGIDKVYDEDTLAARRYAAGEDARINFFEGYVPEDFGTSFNETSVHLP
jgi:hypothetical protein